MDKFFVSGKEIVTFSSAQEAVEKIDYLLQHPNERRAIAKAGQDRTLKEHTIMNKCEQIDQVVQARI
jgi:spore maturation protein CgeB